MKSLAIIVTHPIQYYVPLFKLLDKYCNVKVFYTWGEKGANAKYDPGFNKTVTWDVPLLAGYTYEFLTNTSKDAGSHHFGGIANPDLIEKIKAFQPDAVLIYGWAYKSHLTALSYFKKKIPIWFRGDSTLLDEQKGIKTILRGFFLKWLYSHVDLALYVGSESKKYFKKFGLKERQLIFAPHAIDNERFAEDRGDEAQQIRTSLSLKNDDILILFAGKLERKKNPELLLEAFIEIDSSVPARPAGGADRSSSSEEQMKNEKRTNLHLLFVGNGELEESLKSRVDSLESTVSSLMEDSLKFGVEAGESNPPPTLPNSRNKHSKREHNLLPKERIHFMDFQNQTQMPAVYQACDLFCLPSQGPGETWGLAVNEAMACGKAVLASDKVGCAQDLVTKETGLIFKSNDLNDLKQKLIALTRDKKQLVEMGKSAQLHIQNWSFEEQLKAILNQLNG